jgi:hypothetical protein
MPQSPNTAECRQPPTTPAPNFSRPHLILPSLPDTDDGLSQYATDYEYKAASGEPRDRASREARGYRSIGPLRPVSTQAGTTASLSSKFSEMFLFSA